MSLAVSVKIKLFDRNYVINYPTVQQLIDIENMKYAMSGGNYGALARTGTKQSDNALNFIDALSTFMVLIPQLKEVISETDMMNLSAIKAKEIIQQYVKHFYPWYQDIEKQINEASIIEEDDKAKSKE